ncbi:NACHT domain-containing protein [Streptomyces sp. NPDC005322]|uniref:NACHT domain-containing protein n=1 Tax=Streptomyces sp. NPDC005322 TaxID=3157032 RepID=UPI0033B9E30D
MARWLLGVPPVAAVAYWLRDVFTSYPLPAGVLTGCALLVLPLARKVHEELQKRVAERTADRIDRQSRGRQRGFERRYRHYLRMRYGSSDVRGLRIRGCQGPRLDEVFVDVSLSPLPPHEAGRTPLTGPESAVVRKGQRLSLGTLLADREPAVLAVIGAPGTGKSTLLDHTALSLAGTRRRLRRRRRRDLPVLLALRHHVADIVPSDESAPDTRSRGGPSLPELIELSLAGAGLEVPAGWFAAQLGKGRCVVMLDGLDEVARADHRQLVADWVDRQASSYDKNHWVVTSRPHGYETPLLRRAKCLAVRRMTPDQVTRFVRSWYHWLRHVGDEGQHGPDELLRRLRTEPVLYDLAVNPLLLTIIVNVYAAEDTLPGRRSELYEQIFRVLLRTRQQAKALPESGPQADAVVREAALRELAYRMTKARRRDVSTAEAEAWLRPRLSDAHFPDADTFLKLMAAIGLLVESQSGVHEFAHLTFQEYLAAAWIHQHAATDVLLRAVADPWWRETIVLWAARTEPGRVVRACAELRTPSALALAEDCVEEAGQVAPETRTVLSRLVTPDSSRLMTAVAVERHLRRAVWLSEDTVVCARPITGPLYRLFAADHPQLVGPPDQEPPGGPTGGDAAPDVVAGVPASAARAFPEWVNRVLDGRDHYRLPEYTEADDPVLLPLLAPNQSVWTLSAGAPPEERPQLWVPAGTPHPWRSHSDRIWLRTQQDLRSASRRRRTDADRADEVHRGVLVLLEALTSDVTLLRHTVPDPQSASDQGGIDMSTQAEFSARRYLDVARKLGARQPWHGDGPVAQVIALGLDLTRLATVAELRALTLPLLDDPPEPLRIFTPETLLEGVPRALAEALERLGDGFESARLLSAVDGMFPTETLDSLHIRAGFLAGLAMSLQDKKALPIPEGSRLVDTETAAERLAQLPDLVRHAGPLDPAKRNHVAELAGRLSAVGSELLARGVAGEPGAAAAVRLGALHLGNADPAFTDACHEVAAAVTVLQDRADGMIPASETILLVRC